MDTGQDARGKWKAEPRKLAKPKRSTSSEDSITPEMRAMAEALAHPEGDPYDNARKMGFYCEQCG